MGPELIVEPGVGSFFEKVDVVGREGSVVGRPDDRLVDLHEADSCLAVRFAAGRKCSGGFGLLWKALYRRFIEFRYVAIPVVNGKCLTAV
jgi:hypothetical protein